MAVSYAAVASLVTSGSEEALSSIDRKGMWSFLLSMCRSKQEGGGVHVCAGMLGSLAWMVCTVVTRSSLLNQNACRQ